MIITCKECNASFNLDENLLKPTGSKVRCSKCNEVFLAYPPKISEKVQETVEIESEIEDQPDVKELETEKKETAVEDELDFSDMEELLDEEKAPEGEDATGDEAAEDLELDLDLDMPTDDEKVKEGIAAGVEEAEADDFDLSDLEDLLDEEESVLESVADDAVEDLKLEADSESDAVAKMPPKSDDLEDLDELDLSDLEEVLDLEEPMSEDESVPEDIELELDMEAEPELEQAPVGDEDEDLETVDLSEIEKMLEVEETETKVEPEDKELDLELDLEEGPPESPLPEDSSKVEVYELDEAEEASEEPEAVEAAEDEGVKPEFEFEEPVEEEQIEDETADIEPAVAVAASAKGRRVSRPLVFLLVLVLLAGGSYGTYVLLDYLNIEIPFVSDYLKPKVADPKGSLKIDTLDINSKFILNVKAGKLFVITGKIKNGYSDARRFISITGRLYTKGKTLAKTETVFCGNVLSDIELSNMDLEAIKKRLSNRFGDDNSNLKVEPGKELPFMIVFSNLPENPEEFSVEAAGSTSTSVS
ncbi:MAG: DUF3426 domain-containing protein [Desulfobacterales bacterium]